MNARIKEKKEPDNFKPFTLEIDVETLDELKYLWMVFDSQCEIIVDQYKQFKNSERLRNVCKINKPYINVTTGKARHALDSIIKDFI